jgi:hypothetical protein
MDTVLASAGNAAAAITMPKAPSNQGIRAFISNLRERPTTPEFCGEDEPDSKG